MAEAEPEILQSVLRGQHGGIEPEFLRDDQAHRLINVDIRGGKASSKPAMTAVALPEDGVFQGSFTYRLNSTDRVVVVVSGRVHTYNVSTGVWTFIEAFPTTDFSQAYFCQADKYLIVQNGIYDPVENWPIILDGDSVVDNLAVKQDEGNGYQAISDMPDPDTKRVPIGEAMAYVQGRLFVAVDRYWDDGAATGLAPAWAYGSGVVNWIAGDVKNATLPATLLAFTDRQFLDDTPLMGMPAEIGYITSMATFRNASSGSGLGELIVLGREGVAAYAVAVPRAQWSDPTANIAQILFSTGGSDSHWATIQVNADLVYYGRDGFRSIRYTASTETGSGSLSTIPISTEIRDFTDETTRAQAKFVSMAVADNYVVATACATELADGSTAFRAIVPWDVAVVSGGGAAPEKAFSGAWCGQLYHSVLSFRASNGIDSLATVYRDDASSPLKLGIFDKDVVSTGQISRVYTKEYLFKSLVALKRFMYIQAAFSEIRSSSLTVRYGWRVDKDKDWHWSDTVTFNPSETPAATGPFRLASPAGRDFPCLNQRQVDSGFSFQFVIEWTGDATLDYAIFRANQVGLTSDRDQRCGDVTLTPSEGVDLSPKQELINLEGTP